MSVHAFRPQGFHHGLASRSTSFTTSASSAVTVSSAAPKTLRLAFGGVGLALGPVWQACGAVGRRFEAMWGRLHKDPNYGASWDRLGGEVLEGKDPPPTSESRQCTSPSARAGGNPPAGRARDEVPSFARSPLLPTARHPGAPVNLGQLYDGS